jgi:Iron/zinc purple acid phosphatase-like protein C
MTHIINGMAGNIESHSELSGGILNITAVLDTNHYGFSKLTVLNATALRFQFVLGNDGSIGDELLLLKPSHSSSTNGTTSSTTRMTGSTSA